MKTENLSKETINKIENYKYASNLKYEFEYRILKMIQETVFPNADEIIYIDFDNDSDLYDDENMVHVCYGYGDGYGREVASIPWEWLNEDFDYKTDYKENRKRKHIK